MRIRHFFCAAVVLATAVHTDAAGLIDPALHFRTLTTAHFIIYFHQGEDRLAGRLAVIAEEEWPKVGAALGVAAPRRTHVILADQSEVANGFATPLPYDLIFVTAAAPPGSDFIGRTDDWLRLVFTHEFTHIVHLDRSEGWARLVRGVFGRTSIAFPNAWLPIWQIEGLATWAEGAITGGGRLYAGDFLAIEREAARAGRVEPLDRVNGGLTDWPAGLAPYAFGLGFYGYLEEQFGEPRVGALAERTARSLPFLGSRAFKAVYGRSLGEMWRDYQKHVALVYGPSNTGAPADRFRESNMTRLTHDGFVVAGPRFAPPACAECPLEIVYSFRSPDGFPTLKIMSVDCSNPLQLGLRYLGSTVGVSSGTIVFDQQELHRNVSLYSDLYALDRQTGIVRTLTANQRLQDPDLSPDGQAIVAVRQFAGRGELVVVSGVRRDASETIVLSEVDSQFNAPRWSPDGRQVAVERHRLGALSEIIIVDVMARSVRVIASDPSVRFVTPAWRPDGQAIVAAVDTQGLGFNICEFTLSDPFPFGRPLTDVQGSVLWPDFSPHGDLITFAGYTADGFDVFTQPYVPFDGSYKIERGPGTPPTIAPALEALPTKTRDYSPWGTLPPTSWFPVVATGDQLRAGIGVNGADVLGRHAYSASATWLVDRPAGGLTPREDVPDWDLGYAYDRWQPTLFASATSHTLFGAGPADANGHPTPATLRTREFEGGVLLPFRRVLSARRVFLSVVRTDDRYTLTSDTVTISRTASRIGLAATTAREYGYSVSPEDGYAVGTTAQLARRSLGSSADETTLTVDGRAYVPGFRPHHVVAIRGAAGTSSGSDGAQRTFLLGGFTPAVDVLDFGREAISLLRGFPSQSFAGTHAAVVNADYRWPIARPQRGAGTWPLFVHTIHAAVFADAGDVWTTRVGARGIKTSAGAELSLKMVAGYSFPFTATVGAAWGHDATDRSDRATAYVRIGRAF